MYALDPPRIRGNAEKGKYLPLMNADQRGLENSRFSVFGSFGSFGEAELPVEP